MAFGRLQVLDQGGGGTGLPGPLSSLLPFILLCLWIALNAGPAQGDTLWQEDDQRLRVGLKLFPAVLGALESPEDEAVGDRTLRVAVVSEGSPEGADRAASALRAIGQIRDRPLRVVNLDAKGLDSFTEGPLGGVFVASPGFSGARLRAWSERLRTLVFSPFPGDVEAGAVAGIHVSDQILPFLNLPQARRAGVRFRPFLLRVARHYE